MFYGFLEDNTQLVAATYSNLSLKDNSEIIFYSTFFNLAKFFNSIQLLNIFILVLVLVNTYSFYLLFSKFNNNKFISILMAILVTVSPFSLYKSQNHLGLMNIWILSSFILVIHKIVSNKESSLKILLYGSLLGLTGLISNYHFFFGILFSLLFFIIFLFLEIYNKSFKIILSEGWYIKIPLFFVSLSLPFLIINYSFVTNTNLDSIGVGSKNIFKRPIEDFFIFSSRPWYYFLPSVDNPFFGDFSKKVLETLHYYWGNFLTNNYFKSEHSSSFLGYLNFILALVGFRYILRNKNNIKEYRYIFTIGLVGILLILFTMPPYLEFKGFYIYFPSFLIAKYLSMFRVLSRIGVLILLIQLIFTSYGYSYIFYKLRNRSNNVILFSYALVILIFIGSVSEFYIPFKITDVSVTPNVYKYIYQKTPVDSKIAFLPENKSKEVYFWKKDYKRSWFDLDRKYYINEKLVPVDEFLDNTLYTCEGMRYFSSLDADYFVYFFNSDKGSDLKVAFLNKTLERLEVFSDIQQPDLISNRFYSIIFTGNNISNQSIIYKIPQKIICN